MGKKRKRNLIAMKSVVMTCGACPSQWDGDATDGRRVYIRYRWGCLSVRISNSPHDSAFDGESILFREMGDSLDGSMSTIDMIDATGEVLNWSECNG